MNTKKVSPQSIIGQLGANLIERIVLQMKSVWRPLLIFDVGIDGEIEVCDPNTGEATNTILRVQAKATTQPFQAETSDTFEYICDERDLNYWLRGNTPVVLIVCRPSTDEAYWVVVKEYFADLVIRKSRKVVFDKKRNRFDVTCAQALMSLALPKDSGLYFAPLSTEEALYTNLLNVSSVAPTIWVASTEYRDEAEIRRELRARGGSPGSEWMVKSKQIISFHDLEKYPFNELCDTGTIESFDTSEWSDTDDRDRKNDFVHLLNLCLKERTRLLGLRYHDKREYFYFPATKNLRTRKILYGSLKLQVRREVFKAYRKKDVPAQIMYCRHAAFEGNFLYLLNDWYLEITPTYHFTWDGIRKDKFSSQRVAGIKRLERNPAVLGQLLMWAHFLGSPLKNMFSSEYPFLSFGSLETVEMSASIPDDVWYYAEEGGDAKSMQDMDNQPSLWGL